MKKTLCALICAAGVSVALSGCAPLVVGGAAAGTAAVVSTALDRRAAGTVVNDGVLEKRIAHEISQALGKDVDNHITVTAYNGKVLLTGEIATQKARRLAGSVASKSANVVSVVNQLAVMPNVSMTQRVSDSALATKIRAKLVATEEVYLSQLKIVVDRGIVYIMGIVTPQENTLATVVAARTSGVQRVLSFCDVMSAEAIQELMKNINRQEGESLDSDATNQ